MSYKQILDDISQGMFDQLQTRVTRALAPIFASDNCSRAEYRDCGVFCIKLFHASVPLLGSGVKKDLVRSVVLCCRAYARCRDYVQLPFALTVHKLLYHIVSKLPPQDFAKELTEIAEFLYEELSNLDRDLRETCTVIVMNSYTSLWNSALKLEDDSQFTDFEISSNLRFVAVKFLTLNPENNPVPGDKAEMAFTRFIDLQNTRKDAANLIPQFLLVFEKFYEILVLFSKNPDHCCYIFKLVIVAVKFFLERKVEAKIDLLLELTKSVPVQSFNICEIVTWLSKTLIQVDSFLNKETVEILFVETCLTRTITLTTNACVGSLPFYVSDTFCESYVTLMKILGNIGLNRKPSQLSLLLNTLLQTLDVGHRFLHEFLLLENVTDSRRCKQISVAILGTSHVKLQLQYWLLTNAETDESLEKMLKDIPGLGNTGSMHTKIGEWSIKTLNQYLQELETSALDAKHKMEEKHVCGYFLVKLGQVCLSNGLDDPALEFYKAASCHLSFWCYSNSKNVNKRVQECSLWKIYSSLADCHRRKCQWLDAMETIVICLILDHDHVTSLMKTWFQVKKDAAKAGLEGVMTKTVKDEFEKKDAKLDEEYILLCLEAEFQVFHVRRKYPEAERAILNELITLASDPEVKATYLMKLVQVLWLTEDSSEKSPKEYLNKVFDILKTSSTNLSCLILGEANLWKFIVSHDDICRQMIVSKSESETEITDDEDKQTDSVISDLKLHSLSIAERDSASLIQAVQLWEKGISETLDDSFDLDSLSHSMLICASVLRLCRKPFEEITVLLLALKVSAHLNNQENVCKAKEKLVTVLLEEGFYKMAAKFVSAAEEDLSEELSASLLIAKGQLLLMTGQVTESFNMVEKNPISNSNKCWQAFFVDGKRKRLLSKILCQPYSQQPSSELSALDLAHEAVRTHTGVVNFLLGKEFLKGKNSAKELHSLDKWTIVTELLQSLLHLGQMCRHIGEERDAHCYLKEGIKISQALCISKWYSQFLLEMARLQSLAGNTDGSVRLLSEVATILEPESHHNMKIKPVLTKHPQTPVIRNLQHIFQKPERLGSLGELGFESVRDAGVMTSVGEESVFVSMSPSLYRDLRIDVHVADCQCPHCSDCVAQKLSLVHSIATGEVFFYNGLLDKADLELKTTDDRVKNLETFVEKRRKILRQKLSKMTESGSELPDSLRNGKDLEIRCEGRSDVASLQIESCCLQAEICLQNSNPHVVKTHTDKAMGLLHEDVSMRPLYEAQIVFLSVQAEIQKAGVYHVSPQSERTKDDLSLSVNDQHSSISELTNKMKQCRLLDDLVTKTETDVIMEVDDTGESLFLDKDNSNNHHLESDEMTIFQDIPSANDYGCDSSSKTEPETKPRRNIRKVRLKKETETDDSTPVTSKNISSKRQTARKKTSALPKSETTRPSTRNRKNLKADVKEGSAHLTSYFSPYKPLKRRTNRQKESTATDSTVAGSASDLSVLSRTPDLFDESDNCSLNSVKENQDVSVNQTAEVKDDCYQGTRKCQKSLVPLGAGNNGDDDDDDFELKTIKPKRRIATKTQETKCERIVKQTVKNSHTENVQIKDDQVTRKLRASWILKPKNDPNPVAGAKTYAKVGQAERTYKRSKDFVSVSSRTRIRKADISSQTPETSLPCPEPSLSETLNLAAKPSKIGTSSKTSLRKPRNTRIKNTENSFLPVAAHSYSIYDLILEDSPVKKTRSCDKRGKKRPVKVKVKTEIDDKENTRQSDTNTTDTFSDEIWNKSGCDIEKSPIFENDTKNFISDVGILHQSFEMQLHNTDNPAESSFLQMGIEEDKSKWLNSGLYESVGLEKLVSPGCLADSPELLRADERQDEKQAVTKVRKKSQLAKRTTKRKPVKKVKEECTDEVLRAEVKTLTCEQKLTDRQETQTKQVQKQDSLTSDHCQELDHDSVTSTLEKAFNQMRYFPRTLSYIRICRLLALQYSNLDPYKTAFYLMEASAVTLRHQAIVNTCRKTRKLLKEERESSKGDKSSLLQKIEAVRKELIFDKDVQHFKHMVDSIPEDWTVCQFSVVEIPANPPRLFITRIQSHVQPVTVELPGFLTSQGKDILPEFASIMQESTGSMKIRDKSNWWQLRGDLNSRLQTLLENVETHWLGCWKILLLGLPQNRNVRKSLETAAESLSQKITQEFGVNISVSTAQVLIEAGCMLNVRDLTLVVSTLVNLKTEPADVTKLVEMISAVNIDCLKTGKRCPILLVLDKAVQHLPWESIPVLSEKQVTRIPSLLHLHTQVQHIHTGHNDICIKGVDTDNTFFVLNPDEDLLSTQRTFEEMFTKAYSWSGVSGQKPTTEQICSALTEKDLFVYCGHGSGNRYLHGEELQQLNCQAAVVLMGCSSGQLPVKGQLEASGVVLNYFLSGCACVVANLWDVTDRDIDRFLERLLQLWTSSAPGTSLLDVIPESRQACRLTSLIGSAPVVYGLPVFLYK